MMFSECLRDAGISIRASNGMRLSDSDCVLLGRSLIKAANYIEDLERAIEEQRRARDVQSAMRVEAQSRAARLAKDARR